MRLGFKLRKVESSVIRSSLMLELIASVIAGLSAYFWGVLITSESWLYDWKMSLRSQVAESRLDKGGKAEFPVTVISVTENDRNRFENNQLDRRFLADLLHDLERFQPRMIGVDYLLERPASGPGEKPLLPEDRYLLDTLRQYRNIVLGLPLIETSRGFQPPDTDFLQHHLKKTGVHFGVVNMSAEQGETPPVRRRTSLLFPDGIRDYPSFAFMLFLGSLFPPETLTPELVTSPTNLRAFLAKHRAKLPRGLLARLDDEPFIDYGPLSYRLAMNDETASYFRKMAGAVYTVGLVDDVEALGAGKVDALAGAGILRRGPDDVFFDRSVRTRRHLETRLAGWDAATRTRLLALWDANCPVIPAIKDKVVLVGATYYNEDLHHTPLFRETMKREYGVQVHARIFNMLREGRFITEAGSFLNFLLFLINLGLVVWYMWTQPFRRAALFYAAHFAGFFAVNLFCFIALDFQYEMIAFFVASCVSSFLILFLRFVYTDVSNTELSVIFSPHASADMIEAMQVDGRDWFRTSTFKGAVIMSCWPAVFHEKNGLSLERRAKILDDYHSYIGTLVRERGGLFYRLPASGMMGVWNVVSGERAKPADTLAIAHEALKINEMLYAKWRERLGLKQAFTVDVALHMGDVIGGVTGQRHNRDYTIEGEEIARVIAIARLFAEDKENWVLMTEEFYRLAKAKVNARKVARQGITCWRVLGLK